MGEPTQRGSPILCVRIIFLLNQTPLFSLRPQAQREKPPKEKFRFVPQKHVSHLKTIRATIAVFIMAAASFERKYGRNDTGASLHMLII